MSPGEASSTTRLLPSATAWSDLANHLHEFAHTCFMEHVGATLLVAFTNCDRLFQDFARRARTVFNDSRPPLFEINAPMSLLRAADALLVKWHDFLQAFALVTRAGAPPVYVLLGDRLSAVVLVLDGLAAAFSAPQPLVAIGPIRKVKGAIEMLRSETVKLETRASLIAARDCGPEDFQERLDVLVGHLRGLFFNVISRNSMIVTGIPALRRELSSVCDEIVRVNEGVVRFEDLEHELSRAIDAAGDGLTGLFQALSITPRIVIVRSPLREEERTPEKREPPPRKMDAMVVNSCKRMQASIGELKSALDDTRALFPSKR